MKSLLSFAFPGLLVLGQLFEKYVFNDWDIIAFLMVLITIDTITGFYAAWCDKGVNSFRLRSMFEKVGFYFIALVVVHVLTAHLIDGQPNQLFQTVFPMFKGLIYVVLLGAEVLSIDENASKVGRGFLPKGIRQKLKALQKTGKVDPRIDDNELL